FEQPEELRQVQQGDGLAGQVGQHRDAGLDDVDDRLDRLGDLLDFLQHRSQEIGNERAEIEIDVVERDLRRSRSVLEVEMPLEVELRQDPREGGVAAEARRQVEIDDGVGPEL